MMRLQDNRHREYIMETRLYYAYWLDSEYMNPRTGTSWQLKERRQEIVSAMKILALLGDNIALSDMQLIDSTIILELLPCPFIA